MWSRLQQFGNSQKLLADRGLLEGDQKVFCPGWCPEALSWKDNWNRYYIFNP